MSDQIWWVVSAYDRMLHNDVYHLKRSAVLVGILVAQCNMRFWCVCTKNHTQHTTGCFLCTRGTLRRIREDKNAWMLLIVLEILQREILCVIWRLHLANWLMLVFCSSCSFKKLLSRFNISVTGQNMVSKSPLQVQTSSQGESDVREFSGQSSECFYSYL